MRWGVLLFYYILSVVNYEQEKMPLDTGLAFFHHYRFTRVLNPSHCLLPCASVHTST